MVRLAKAHITLSIIYVLPVHAPVALKGYTDAMRGRFQVPDKLLTMLKDADRLKNYAE